MTARVKCPRERQAKAGQCEREGCNHYASERARICGCCAQQLGSQAASKLSLMRVYAKGEAFERAQDEALAVLNAMPPRRPLGAGWPGEPNRRLRRAG